MKRFSQWKNIPELGLEQLETYIIVVWLELLKNAGFSAGRRRMSWLIFEYDGGAQEVNYWRLWTFRGATIKNWPTFRDAKWWCIAPRSPLYFTQPVILFRTVGDASCASQLSKTCCDNITAKLMAHCYSMAEMLSVPAIHAAQAPSSRIDIVVCTMIHTI